MKRLLLLPLLLLAMSLSAKTGRIPSYMSFVYWIQGTDTLYDENNTLLHESVSPDGTVTIRVRHEDWKSTVTNKSLLRLAPWHAAVSQRRGIRAIIHQGQSNTDAMMPMKKIPGMVIAGNMMMEAADKIRMTIISARICMAGRRMRLPTSFSLTKLLKQ